MSTSYWLDSVNKKAEPQTDQKNFDVIIIGAGISGLSTAYWIQQEDPSLKVAILEKGSLGSGATGRNAGFVTCGSVEHFNRMVGKFGEKTALDIWRFSESNLSLIKDHIIQDDASECDFMERGTYSLAAEASEFTELQEVAQIMDDHKIPVETLKAEEIESRLGVVQFVGGIKYMGDAEVHPIKLLHLINKRCQISIIENTEVLSVEPTDGGARTVKTNQGDYQCDLVVACANGYSPKLSTFFNEKIYPTRGQILITEPCDSFMDAPCYANHYLDYFRQLTTGEILIGGFRQLEKDTEVGYSDHTTDVIQNALHDFIKKHVPRAAPMKVTHRWGGVMGFSQDGNPIVGSLPDDSQFFFACGYTAHGIGLAFHTCKALVDGIFGRPVPDWLSSRRF